MYDHHRNDHWTDRTPDAYTQSLEYAESNCVPWEDCSINNPNLQPAAPRIEEVRVGGGDENGWVTGEMEEKFLPDGKPGIIAKDENGEPIGLNGQLDER